MHSPDPDCCFYASGEALDANRVVRDVLVKVGEDQEQFEHPLALTGVGLLGAFFQVVHDQQRVGKQPFESLRIDGTASAAALNRLVGANERLLKEVVEAQLFRSESARNCVGTRPPPTCRQSAHVHDPHPRPLESMNEYETVARA
jgi:hypothetical protein